MTTPKPSPRTLRPQDYQNPKPIYAVWEITLRCDHACSHCGSRAEFARTDELNTEQLLEEPNLAIRFGADEHNSVVELLAQDVLRRVETPQLLNDGIMIRAAPRVV